MKALFTVGPNGRVVGWGGVVPRRSTWNIGSTHNAVYVN